jgi:hypothetical protein
VRFQTDDHYSEKNERARAFESGFTPDEVLIVHRERSFIDRTLFDLWVETLLLPEIQRRRIECQHEGNAVLILHGCASHESDWLSTRY